MTNDIKVGDIPWGIAVNPNNNRVYVANLGSNTVSVIDSTTNEVTTNDITLGGFPSGIAVNPNNNLVYVANEFSDTISVIDNTTTTMDITVGGNPGDIAVNTEGNYPSGLNSDNPVYVANGGSNTVSVIDVYTSLTQVDAYTHEVLTNNITVGDSPKGIAVNLNNNLVYVANWGSDTVSVIDPYLNSNPAERAGKVYTNITVGDFPEGIAVIPNNNLVYVANSGSNTLSVINSTTNEVLTNDITVGDSPSGIAVNPNNNLVYVANGGSNTLSVIDSKTNDNVVRASFNIKPVDSGQIVCNTENNTEKIPTNEYKTIKFDSICEAIPNNGFAFSSWVQRFLDSNSSLTITESTPNSNFLSNLLFPNPNDNDYNKFNIDSSGNFVANFRETPPPVPDAIWIALFSILLGTFMPSIIRWINGWKQRRRFYKYMEKELPSKYKEKDRQGIDGEIAELYAKGKINESQHKMLKDKIAEHYDQGSKLGPANNI